MPILGIIASSKLTVLNSYESIATVTVGSGGSSTIEFTSISSAYTHLQLRYFERATGSYVGGYVDEIQFNSDTGSNYSWHELLGDGSTAIAAASATQTSMRAGRMPAGGITASVFGTTIVDILDYANTNKYKTIRVLGAFDTNSASPNGAIVLGSGNWRSTSAITSIKLTPAAETFAQYSSFALYGIKGA
jgi:hypothetical protein